MRLGYKQVLIKSNIFIYIYAESKIASIFKGNNKYCNNLLFKYSKKIFFMWFESSSSRIPAWFGVE